MHKSIEGLLAKYKEIPGERFFHEIFDNNEYESVLKYKNDVVIDVGALAGEFSAYIYPQAKIIYALEPNSAQFKELEDNVKEFDLTKIKPLKLALSGSGGKRFLAQANRGGQHLDKDIAQDGEEVETLTLADLINKEKIKHVDVVKIDIEGGEAEVFRAADFPSVANRISLIIGEHLSESRSLLENLGFTYEDHGSNSIYKR